MTASTGSSMASTSKIPDGAYCCFLGPSGCGKTTILRMIAGHEDPTDGEILIGGQQVVGLAPVERRTAMMFQSYALFPHLNVRDNIAFALRVRGLSTPDRRKAADAMIEKVRLTELADRLPAQLSGGQQQRVALARAAITGPKVLLLDEPLSALDEQLRVQMRQELSRMQRDLGITFIHVTHTQLEAIAIADIVVVMEKGRIKQAGPARDVYDQPRDRYVAEFLGGQNVLSGRIERIEGDSAMISAQEMRDVVVPLGSRRTVSAGDRVDFAVRRDDVDLVRPEMRRGPPARQGAEPGSRHRISGQFRQGHPRQHRQRRIDRLCAGPNFLSRSLLDRRYRRSGMGQGQDANAGLSCLRPDRKLKQEKRP